MYNREELARMNDFEMIGALYRTEELVEKRFPKALRLTDVGPLTKAEDDLVLLLKQLKRRGVYRLSEEEKEVLRTDRMVKDAVKAVVSYSDKHNHLRKEEYDAEYHNKELRAAHLSIHRKDGSSPRWFARPWEQTGELKLTLSDGTERSFDLSLYPTGICELICQHVLHDNYYFVKEGSE